MLTKSELPANPVILRVMDANGAQETVTAERTRGGKVRITCTCTAIRRQGWCRHVLDLLCLRYDGLVDVEDDETEFHFEDLVMGTPVADLADEVDMALADYGRAVDAFEAGRRQAGDDLRELKHVGEVAAGLAEAALALDGALGRFRKRLAAEAG